MSVFEIFSKQHKEPGPPPELVRPLSFVNGVRLEIESITRVGSI